MEFKLEMYEQLLFELEPRVQIFTLRAIWDISLKLKP